MRVRSVRKQVNESVTRLGPDCDESQAGGFGIRSEAEGAGGLQAVRDQRGGMVLLADEVQ